MIVRTVLFAICSLGLPLTGYSGLIVNVTQDPGTDFIAFEAELFSATFDSGTAWSQEVDGATVVPAPIPAGASGGAGIWVSGTTLSGTESNSNPQRRYEYELIFDQPGTYEFYVRGYQPTAADAAFGFGAPDGNNDSIWLLTAFDADPSVFGNYGGGTFGHPAGVDGAFGWASNNIFLTVAPGQVGTPLTWAWIQRENGPIIDRFAFADTTTSPNLSGAQLDALANSVVLVPEPSSALFYRRSWRASDGCESAASSPDFPPCSPS